VSEPRPIEGATTVDRGWRSAAALFAVACFASVTNPAALLAIPFLLLVGAKGLRGFAMFAAIVLALLASVSGVTDAAWFVERGWALLLGGWFVALSLVWPASRPSTRALGAVFGAAGAAACLMAFRVGAWSALDWAITDRVKSAVAPMLEGVVWMRGGEALAPAVVTSMYDAVDAQLHMFPAITGLASMAALCVVWWSYVRLASGRGQEASSANSLSLLRYYRFNDHLVWVLVVGLVLLVTGMDEPLGRVGANAVVFMGALYALRGAAVVVFISGGVSLIGYVVTGVGLLLVPGILLGGALVIGVGDTWLDVRGRVAEITTDKDALEE